MIKQSCQMMLLAKGLKIKSLQQLAKVFNQERHRWLHIGPDWHRIVKIWDFLRSVSVHFGSLSENVLKLIL